MIISADAQALLARCAPNVGFKTMAGIIEYESGWRSLAIGDNTARQSYFPGSRDDAIRIVVTLLKKGHNLDVGLSQVNSDNWSAYGIGPLTAFDPCTNVHVGSQILTGAYVGSARHNWIGRPIATATDRYYNEQQALIHALSAYNSGGYFASMSYASNVYQIAVGVIGSIPEPSQPLHPSGRLSYGTPATAHHAVSFRPNWGLPPATPRPSLLVTRTAADWSTAQGHR